VFDIVVRFCVPSSSLGRFTGLYYFTYYIFGTFMSLTVVFAGRSGSQGSLETVLRALRLGYDMPLMNKDRGDFQISSGTVTVVEIYE
jgi:hypothetical protein